MCLKRISMIAISTLAIATMASLGYSQAAAPAPAAPAPQGKKQPTAKSQAEFAAYQKFWNAQDADEKIKSAEEFLKAYPETELKIYAYMSEMQSYQVKNDFPHLREFGEKILDLDPNDLPTLITLATAIPERTQETDLDKDQKRTQAEGYAKKAMASIDKLEKPANVPDAQWNDRINDAKSQAHYALGLVDLQRKNYPGAIEELTLAAKLQSPSQPDPILWWRLGLAYEFAKNYPESLKSYEHSVGLGGVKMNGKDQAVEDRDRIKKFIEKK
jgi:tetratricopeptide (TPR) repeat protein